MNRLQYETSPYLLQHANNPVDWYAWKPEAFERAQAENKPILVSIGYSTCHWCHVMERESFENPDIAAFMNDYFINIKVDREERPDVDAIYMDACQIMTGGGGWPLNCFLTPEGKPFFAGTYYPPRPMHNRPSWLQLLQHMSNIWETKRKTAYEQADRIMEYIQRNDRVFLEKPDAAISPDTASVFTPALLEQIMDKMRDQFDRTAGGFGGAPKFPATMGIQYLLNHFWYTGNSEALEHALFSLDKMIMGGIYDQLGGGFARYATDREWLVPHFEKMLYDNALLVGVLADALKLVQDSIRVAPRPALKARVDLYRDTIAESLEYIDREMTHPEGGFFAAQDADSEGVEGKFYVWTKSEIDQLLGEDAALFCSFYGVTEAGNWEGVNILWRPESFEAFAAAHGLEVNALRQTLAACRQTLFEVRAGRIPPGRDDKVILGWNALMCSAYAQAFTALGKETYREKAVRNIEFILEHMVLETDGRLSHTWKDGRAQYMAVLDDYAFLIAALLDIWQITFNSKFLTLAAKYTEQVFSYFHDTESGLFFFTASDQTDVIIRKKDLYDSATPSGNSTMAHVLQRLGILLDRQDWREQAVRMLQGMQATIAQYPLSFERWATALMNEVHPALEIAVLGGNALDKALDVQRRFLPNKVVAAGTEPSADNPLLAHKPASADALIYLCREYACQKPVQSLADFDQLIRAAV
ncbi:MAG: thioredoxin domain-containing protein [Bacteroidetes bacterium]|nr:MAG: thioredoxin domain-containing protein [Bacteroidota bacterium]